MSTPIPEPPEPPPPREPPHERAPRDRTGPVEPALPDPQVGEYVVQGQIGRGAFGTVYQGVHPLIGKTVAIKVLSRRFSADPEMVSRFVAEARAVNQIRHRNIIDIFSFGQLEDGRHYYVMEYLEGETLQALLDREGRLPPGRCVAILRAIGRALDAAHAKGIAHRDLKAENVFLGTDADGGMWPKLLDFGIAKLTSAEDGLRHKTRSGMSIGTPFYMSPEQCHGRQVDHRTDIYAFGILVYLMLTGVFPFDGDSYMEILMQQVSSAPAPPSAHVPELPPAIDDVVMWLLHKEPAQRPPDLRTAVAAFEQAVACEPAATTDAWDALSGGPATRLASVLAPRGSGASQRPGAPAGATGPRGAREPGGAEGRGAEVRARRPSVGAMASLVALTALVAGAVAVYPHPTSHLTARSQPAAPVAPRPLATPPESAVPSRAMQVVPLRDPAKAAGATADLSSVALTIEGVPAGTDVVAHGRRIGAAPGRIELPYGTAPLALTFRAPGYLPVGRSVLPDRDRSLTVTLTRPPARPAARAARRPSRDDIIDVFGAEAP
ncbi:MAG TPA: protein kinase [Kofleriaceae bacterium]|nr:protein kinase [Kofleriaceae bacterium]